LVGTSCVGGASPLLVVILIRSEGYSYLPKGVIGLRRYWVRCTLLGYLFLLVMAVGSPTALFIPWLFFWGSPQKLQ
jgi:hypothetical protein